RFRSAHWPAAPQQEPVNPEDDAEDAVAGETGDQPAGEQDDGGRQLEGRRKHQPAIIVVEPQPMIEPRAASPRRTFSTTGVLTAVGGLALLVWVVWKTGPADIAANVRQVGWGLVAIIAFGGLRFLLRAVAWRLCLDPPHRLGLKDA